ncbi:phosphatase [Salibacterium aidingense]|uniref:phosphatase n=1 Tax=Salibacterium aidingense TaxID=384933 RepID=UPI000410035D|nr:phosphatase [Salibacterium aidingense]
MKEGIGMKKLAVGLSFLFLSTIIYGFTLISASVYSHTLAGVDGQGWDTNYGVFGTALREIGGAPVTLSILSGIIGLVFVVLSLKKIEEL